MSSGEDQHRFILRLRTAGSPHSVANPSRCRGVIGEVTELDRRHPKKRLRFAVGAVDARLPSGARRFETAAWRGARRAAALLRHAIVAGKVYGAPKKRSTPIAAA